MAKVYTTWRDFPLGEWRWTNFKPQELASKREGELLIDPASMDKLQALRTRLGKPLIITSAYRSAAHNRAVGGAKNSQHRLAKAYDVSMANHDPAVFEREARAVGFTGFGHYSKSNFMHIDTGPARRWNDGTWFPAASDTKAQATPEFPAAAEPKNETVSAMLMRPEVLASAGGILTGAAGVSQGSGPVQYAIAAVLVVAACALVAWVVSKALARQREV